MYQLTNPVSESRNLWDWKAYINDGVNLLQTKQQDANVFLTSQRSQAQGGIPEQQEGYVSFSDADGQCIQRQAVKDYSTQHNVIGASGDFYVKYGRCLRTRSPMPWAVRLRP